MHIYACIYIYINTCIFIHICVCSFYKHYHSSWCGVVGVMPRAEGATNISTLCPQWEHIAQVSAYWALHFDLVDASPEGLDIQDTPGGYGVRIY